MAFLRIDWPAIVILSLPLGSGQVKLESGVMSI